MEDLLPTASFDDRAAVDTMVEQLAQQVKNMKEYLPKVRARCDRACPSKYQSFDEKIIQHTITTMLKVKILSGDSK